MANASMRSASLPRVLRHFLRTEAAGGIVMLGGAALALLMANTALREWYHTLIATPLWHAMSLTTFVGDVLMAVFFLAVGMELKREMREGVLADRGQRVLPLIAAGGGILLPTLIYLGINHAVPANQGGWAIPTATDIAFALCVLNLVGKRVPSGAKIFLLAIAIYDDLAAIIIIALFYSHGIALQPLAGAAATLVIMLLLNRRNVTAVPVYLCCGALLWYFVHASGVHSTVAGMLTGLLVPMREAGKNSPSPLNKCLHALHPWVSFFILPLFALVSAGVDFSTITAEDVRAPLGLGIALALFIGKQAGVFAATYAAVRCNLATRPNGTSWSQLYGICMLAGIGFTMSLFIGQLAFADPALQNPIRLGVMGGSLLSAILGAIVLKLAARAHD